MAAKSTPRKTPLADETTITLRGLRVAWSPERVVPWAELVTRVHDAGMTVWSIDSEGEPLRVAGRRVRWQAGPEHQRTVAGMVQRSRKRALESGQYLVTVNRSGWMPLVGIWMIALGIALVAAFVAEMAWPRALWLWRAWNTLSPADRAIELALLLFPTAVIAAFACIPIALGWSFVRLRVRRVTLTGDGLVLVGPDGQVRTILWDDVTSIRGFEVCRIRTRAGDTVSIPNELHAKHVIWHHRRRLHGVPKPMSGRRLIVRVLVILQIGGLIGATIVPFAGMPAWRAYLAIAWGLPLALLVPVGLPRLYARGARARFDAKRRRRRRVSRESSGHAQTRHLAAVSPPPR